MQNDFKKIFGGNVSYNAMVSNWCTCVNSFDSFTVWKLWNFTIISLYFTKKFRQSNVSLRRWFHGIFFPTLCYWVRRTNTFHKNDLHGINIFWLRTDVVISRNVFENWRERKKTMSIWWTLTRDAHFPTGNRETGNERPGNFPREMGYREISRGKWGTGKIRENREK